MNEKILIIDREVDIQKAIAVILKKEGYQTRCASKSKKAVEILKSEPIDLVIMDIRLPEIEGLKLIAEIQKLNGDMGIIVLTGSVSIDNAVKSLRDGGAYDFLTKPLENKAKLISSVNQALGKRRLIKKQKASLKKLEQGYLEMESRVRVLTNELSKINGAQSSKKKILIVDDDLQIQQTLTQVLRTQNLETEVASDGFEAGVKIMEFKPDLIILDLFMPNMDGFEVCKQVKRNSPTSQIKILVITGYDTKENRDRIMAAGADGYMAKPLGVKILLQNVEGLWNRG